MKKMIFLSACFMLLNSGVFAQDGTLDPTFGTGGIVTTVVGVTSNRAQAIALAPDQKIVTGGYAGISGVNEFSTVRYNSNGSLDTDFNGTGKVQTNVGTGASIVTGIAVQTDGKIIVAGSANNGSNNDFALIRLNTDGTLDTGFDTDGIVITPIGSAADQITGVKIQIDGKIVVSGVSNNGTNFDVAVVRYNSNGSLDGTFGTGGIFTWDSGNIDNATSLAIQPDGKIVVSGASYNGLNNDVLVFRLNTNGTFDNSFGTSGRVLTITPVIGNESGNSVAIQSNGKIVIGGTANNGTNDDFLLIRYNSDGSIDNTFGVSGILLADMALGGDSGNSVAIQTDQKIVLIGSVINSGNYNWGAFRANSNGTPDNSFGTSGKTLINLTGAATEQAYGGIIQADHNIVIAGRSATNDHAALRLLATVIPDVPLPIKLLSWQAASGNGVVNLKWETASELENAGFEILRSTSAQSDFVTIASYRGTNALISKGEKGGIYKYSDNMKIVNGQTYYYKLVDISVDGNREEHAVLSAIPTDGKGTANPFQKPDELKISSVYPNPFNPTAYMTFDLPADGFVSVKILNVLGQELAVIRNEFMTKGKDYRQELSAENLPSGNYLISLEYNGQKKTSRFTVLK